MVRRRLLYLQRDKEFKLGSQSQCAYMKLAWNAFAAGERVTEINLPSPATLDIPIDSVTSRYWVEHF